MISLVALAVIVHNILSTVPIDSNTSPYSHQQIMLAAGKYLKLAQTDDLIASWNAGIIGYYQGGTVVNIDGLVNNQIYSYVVNNSLYSYLMQNKIKYIVDFETMLKEKRLRLMGGHDDSRFLICLQPVKVFDDRSDFWQHLTLYKMCP